MSAHFPPFTKLSPGLESPSRSHLLTYSPSLLSSDGPPEDDGNERQPFSFKPQSYVVGRPPAATAALKQAELGRRRGHKYARSSVSHQIILSPTPRTPLQLPTSLPVPTFREFKASMTREQRNRVLFCALQFLIALYVQWQASSSLSLTALSHLLFFDALSAVLCTAVDIGRNFEVWTRSSLRNPFGLERSELVAGLAMSIVLLFMGLDLVSHGLQHSLENKGGHIAHHGHSPHVTTAGELWTAALAAILSTLISATSLGNHTRIGRAICPSNLPSWFPTLLSNPQHLLTLSCASLLASLPLFQISFSQKWDTSFSLLIALITIILGARLSLSLGRVLLMSYPAREEQIRELVADVWEVPDVSAVEEAKVWQVHYGLCMASLKVKVRAAEAVERVREAASKVVERRLKNENGGDRVRWEVSCMVCVER